MLCAKALSFMFYHGLGDGGSWEGRGGGDAGAVDITLNCQQQGYLQSHGSLNEMSWQKQLPQGGYWNVHFLPS